MSPIGDEPVGDCSIYGKPPPAVGIFLDKTISRTRAPRPIASPV